MKEILIVDGYNVINGWPELKTLATDNLEHARLKLIDILANYRGITENEVILVFDASMVPGRSDRFEVVQNIEVIFSKENETADSVIERLVHVMRGKKIFVVTSDWEEQRIIFGSGAYRLPVRQLREDVINAEREIKERVLKHTYIRRTLESGLSEEIRTALEKIRRAK
ncbi:MAG TPA: NYN domain-containing protein [Candidatus Deferrimicrobium sp.]|nr:NYN domain-containing protein [Candidatus Deferrimicrobium sp.]